MPAEFTTQFTGEKKEFASGMVRNVDTNKTKYHLAYEGPMFRRWNELLTRGAKNYGENNWMKANGGEELKRFRESACRHFYQWLMGDVDEDHAAAVFFNINGYEYVKAKTVPALPKQLRRPVSTEDPTKYYWCEEDCPACDDYWATLTREQQEARLNG